MGDYAMLTVFRCFTDGCSAFDGTPLQHHLHLKYGLPVFVVYYILFLFVTIGIFNLIMAIFIERVLDAAVQRKQEELGARGEQMRLAIKEVIGERFAAEDMETSEVKGDLIV